MHHRPAPDVQDENSSSANDGPVRTSRKRVLKACEECHSRKKRCDGAHPCKGCHHNGIECVYQKTEPSKLEKSLASLPNTIAAVVKDFRDLSDKLEGLNRFHFPLHFEPGAKLFLRGELQRLSECYIRNGHALYPFFDKPQQMCDDFIYEPALRKGIINSSIQNAHVLLFFALGSCHSSTKNAECSSTKPGMAYYSYANDILRHKLGECNIPVAQALTLAAFYTNQNGMLEESLTHLYNARDIYTDILKSNTSISKEAKRGFWIYRDLARGINNYFNGASFGPVPDHWSTLLPEENVVQSFERVSLQIQLDTLYNAARPPLPIITEIAEENSGDSTRRPFPEFRTIDEEDMCHLMRVAENHLKEIEDWRSDLAPQSAWEDTDLPSTDPHAASLRAEYYDGVAKLLRPYLEISIYALHSHANSTPETLSKGQQGFLEILIAWVKHALLSLFYFDRVGAASDSTYEMYQKTGSSLVMLSNPVGTLHMEFQKVLLLKVVRSSAVHPLIAKRTKLTEEVMETLRRRTIKRLSEFRPGHRTLTQDLRALNKLWLLENPVSLVELIGVCDLA